jgi:sirohydrochlorin ferrochelatase
MSAPTTSSGPCPGALPGSPAGASDAHLDSTAQLITLITAQLSTRLAHAGARSLRRSQGSAPTRPPTLVVVAHGSRDPAALRAVTALLHQVRAARPGLPVRLGHLGINAPLLPDTLAALRGEAVLVPLLFGRGYHVKHDIPEALAGEPCLRARVAAPLGPHPLLAEALHARLTEAGWRPPANRAAAARHAVVLAAAGSRDPDSVHDAARTAELLGARLGVRVVPACASAAAPTVPDAVADLLSRGRDRIAVSSYFAAPGRFAARIAAQAPGVVAAPIGAHPALARLLLHRYDEALAGQPQSATAFGAAAAVPVSVSAGRVRV